jgi:EAL domain-containing protein (putative c-di-GMP-specific phosphodiesterase class I)
MGHVLKLGVVAEGVESESQLNFLRLQACDAAQGYFIAQPGTADEIGPLLGQRLPQSDSADTQASPGVRPISERMG